MREGSVVEEFEAGPRARRQSACFVCGPENQRGLRLKFETAERGEAVAAWSPEAAFEGFQGIIHGGVVSAVLDESMAKAVAATGAAALTGELRVRFRRRVATGEAYQIRGWVVSRNKRVIATEASLTAADGAEHAHAWASFLLAKNA